MGLPPDFATSDEPPAAVLSGQVDHDPPALDARVLAWPAGNLHPVEVYVVCREPT